MKYCLVSYILLISAAGFAQLPDRTINNLKAGRISNDSSYIYNLPFSSGSKFLLIQAYNSKMSHTDELSLDFKMKQGSKIRAAREGVVERVSSE
ncbi:hypothetical protein [Ferruginibacter sp. HRS2-29]|uniref:hypothetical protein n=1 Tax=Ferruginibacter sp. HRS2-29 TaxID=2487334 RepID=UPI0020CC21A6|nr:hypothetical protein [Ferruginibacter sp. HRS2-29]